MLIGLTGNIGSGKSAVGEYMASLGAHHIQADKVVHELYASTSTLPKRLASQFGKEILAKDGSVDRKALSALVFSDEAQLEKLNAIVHPLAMQRIQEKVAKLGDDKHVIVEAALIFEANWQHFFDLMVIVVASKREREKRLLRKGMSPEAIRRVLDVQVPSMGKVAQSHYVIDNAGTVDEMKRQVNIVWQELQK
jgi:dephospho-CoA kinase